MQNVAPPPRPAGDYKRNREQIIKYLTDAALVINANFKELDRKMEEIKK